MLKAGFYKLNVSYFHANGKILEGLRDGSSLNIDIYAKQNGWSNFGHDFMSARPIPNEMLFYDADMFSSSSVTEQFNVDQKQILEEKVRSLSTSLEELELQLNHAITEKEHFLKKIGNLGVEASSYSAVVSSIEKMRVDYFFSLGLAYKMGSGINVNLSQVWERVELMNIKIEEWPSVFNQQI